MFKYNEMNTVESYRVPACFKMFFWVLKLKSLIMSRFVITITKEFVGTDNVTTFENTTETCCSKYAEGQKITQSYLQKIDPAEGAIRLKKRDFAIRSADVQSVIAGWQLLQKKIEAQPGAKKKKNGGGYC